MRYIALLITALVFYGCASSSTIEQSLTEPVLLKQAPLPEIPLSLSDRNVEITCEFVVGRDGTIKKVKLVNSSGDKTWDYLAEQSFMQWEFTPALLNGDPVELRIRRKILISYVEPELIQLAEICCGNMTEAESVYTALKSGADFRELVKKHSISPTKEKAGALGKVDIRYYCKDIRTVLSALDEGEYTKPLLYGDHYVIFKRLKENNGNSVEVK